MAELAVAGDGDCAAMMARALILALVLLALLSVPAGAFRLRGSLPAPSGTFQLDILHLDGSDRLQ